MSAPEKTQSKKRGPKPGSKNPNAGRTAGEPKPHRHTLLCTEAEEAELQAWRGSDTITEAVMRAIRAAR